MWKCPSCNRDDRLTIEATTTLKLSQSKNGDDFSTDATGDAEWAPDSTMTCQACGHVGECRDFEVDEPLYKKPAQNSLDALLERIAEMHEGGAAPVDAEMIDALGRLAGHALVLRELLNMGKEMADMVDAGLPAVTMESTAETYLELLNIAV